MNLSECRMCKGFGVVNPNLDGYDGCPNCNYGDGPTGCIEVSTTQDGMVKIVENGTVKITPPPGFVLRSV